MRPGRAGDVPKHRWRVLETFDSRLPADSDVAAGARSSTRRGRRPLPVCLPGGAAEQTAEAGLRLSLRHAVYTECLCRGLGAGGGQGGGSVRVWPLAED